MKQKIQSALKNLQNADLYSSSVELLNALGYASDKDARDIDIPISHDEIKEAVGLFQLTDEELKGAKGGKYGNQWVESFLFVAVRLNNKEKGYTRSGLSFLTREINKSFAMPVIIVFVYGDLATISVIHRRLNKKDENKDVLEKVTLIKDINLSDSHRAHVEILFDISVFEIKKRTKNKIKNFVQYYNELQKTLGISALSESFYEKFKEHFDALSDNTLATIEISQKEKENFALLFAIRTIFLVFIQKRGWLGGDVDFLANMQEAYKESKCEKDSFYTDWLKLLFLNALNTPPHSPVTFGRDYLPKDIASVIESAPFLNGGLFSQKELDTMGLYINDSAIEAFFDFIFGYKFTLQENTPLESDIDLSPEFLGIIFERLVNKADGAVYTDRVEVDLMCRLSLVSWLAGNNDEKTKLTKLFFDKDASAFTNEQIKSILSKLESVTICDPAVGSGAFPVGMLGVLDEIEQILRNAVNAPEYELDAFERKKRIIQSSLYGVEVKEWAVWITQLRLWLTLFIDAPESMKESFEPILPSLDFKIRQGDSLVQIIGKKAFPIAGHADLSVAIKSKVTKLKNLKIDYFKNKLKDSDAVKRAETTLFREILQAQIDELKLQKANLFGGNSIETASLFGDREQKRLNLLEPLKKEYEAKIAELKEELESVTDTHPLIWNIEFAEVFADKGGFDIVIGNPPYVRQESIADPLDRFDDPKAYKQELMRMAALDFPEFFDKKNMPSGRSDLSVYFYIRGIRLLNSSGKMCYICTNSWLDVDYGAKLQELLLRHAPLEMIVDNHAKRSFESADVNTIISIIEPHCKKVSDTHAVKFVAFKKPFEDVSYADSFSKIFTTNETIARDDFRVYCASNVELLESGMEMDEEEPEGAGEFKGDKWGGKYLRAPEIFFTILAKGKDKLVRLGDIADVRFGLKTGANDFFYLDKEAVEKWGIEEEFLRAVVKSPRECKAILVDPNDLQLKVFMCNKTKEELKGTNALKYIEWGETAEIEVKEGGKKKTIFGYQNIESIKNRRLWYFVGEMLGNTFWGKEIRERIATFISKDYALADCRLYYAIVDKEIQAQLNSTLYAFLGETLKRDLGGGGGPRSLMVYEVQDSFILKQELINFSSFDFDSFAKRKIESIFVECGIDPNSSVPIEEQTPKPLPDRAALDKIVFDALGLSDDERVELYRAVCRLVYNRISKAKSV